MINRLLNFTIHPAQHPLPELFALPEYHVLPKSITSGYPTSAMVGDVLIEGLVKAAGLTFEAS
ncbi:MAG: hypothetical protein AAF572_04705 [Cyanobacteria bacterium P01_B01_bin.77]